MGKASESERERQIFHRYAGNPILTAEIWPYPARAVINPGAVRVNNDTVLLVRVEDPKGLSHLAFARSRDGFANWSVDGERRLEGEVFYPHESLGIEDPRIVWLAEQKQFAITYISHGIAGYVVSLAITKNFRTFARLGALGPPEDRDACLLPRRCRGRFVLIHSPCFGEQRNIWVGFSPDLKHWGDHRPLLVTRADHWDRHRVGLGCQPLELAQGWLMFYYGVENNRGCPVYRVGAALLDLYEPWRVLRRSAGWILEPETNYERVGRFGGVIFPTGATVNQLTNEINLYYGAANHTVGVATADLGNVVDYVMSCPPVE